MHAVTWTQFLDDTRKYLDAVEQGEVLEVHRHGKPVVIVSPVRRKATGRWTKGAPLKRKRTSLSRTILTSRREGR